MKFEYYEPTQKDISLTLKHLNDPFEGSTYKEHVMATIRYLGEDAGYKTGVSLLEYEKKCGQEQMKIFWTLLWYHGVRMDKTSGCLGYFKEFSML